MRGPSRRELLGLYADAPRAVRAHLALRWATCPFPAVAAAVPVDGPVLEVGCGHGLLSSYVALARPGRPVHGVDVAADRIAVARGAATRAGRRGAVLTFAESPADGLPLGPWGAVVLVDVVYLVDPAGQQELIAACAAALAPGGALVVKETDTARRWRAAVTSAQETMAVRVLRFTAGDRPSFVPPATLGAWMTSAGLDVSHRPLGRGYLHPHHLVVGRR